MPRHFPSAVSHGGILQASVRASVTLSDKDHEGMRRSAVSSSVSETSVTREELRRRTAALVPILKERVARTEQLRQIPPETVQDLVASRLIRLGNPPRYGGLDV